MTIDQAHEEARYASVVAKRPATVLAVSVELGGKETRMCYLHRLGIARGTYESFGFSHKPIAIYRRGVLVKQPQREGETKHDQ